MDSITDPGHINWHDDDAWMVHVCQRAMLYQERDILCRVANFTIMEHNAYLHKIVYSLHM
jgi:hypothetical protein